MQEIEGFKHEAQSFHSFISSFDADEYSHPTKFKNWTLNTILTHLWIWNWGAEISSTHPDQLQKLLQEMMPYIQQHKMPEYEANWAHHLSGEALRDKWWESVESLCAIFSKLDPKDRLKWAGPDMSVRSSITARLMETWSHSQAIYDLKQQARPASPALKSIAFLGVNTFGWSFKNNGLDVPTSPPAVTLEGPEGAIWNWHNENKEDMISGSAEEFCQVVTQTRNIADTSLEVSGPIATKWMSIAQCFAGPPEAPPPAGSRV